MRRSVLSGREWRRESDDENGSKNDASEIITITVSIIFDIVYIARLHFSSQT
jgi:hypothetical protein